MTTAAQKTALKTKRSAQLAFAAGAGFSIAANVIASEHSPIGILFGSWPALALLVSVYLYENAPRNFWIKAGILAMVLVAAYASYWHIVDVAMAHGVDPITAHLMPATVDVMMAIAQTVLNKKPSRPAVRRARKPAAKSTGRQLKSVA